LADRIFERIGIKLDWSCTRKGAPPITVEVSFYPDDQNHSTTLADARPSANRIRLYCSRMHGPGMLARAHLMAYALAHEIGHVLQGTSRHSEIGIMKAHWDLADLENIAEEKLTFTPVDILLIQNGTADRIGWAGPGVDATVVR
jgi:hypothetical protein